MTKTVCKKCGEIHDISMPLCDSCLEEWKKSDKKKVAYGCYHCKWVDTSRYKEIDNGLYQRMYGCNHPTYRSGYVVGWCKGDKLNDLKEMGCGGFSEKPSIIKSNDYYMIYEALQVDNKPMYLLALLDKFDYDSHILYSNSLEVLEDEMRKITLKQNGIEQLQLF